MKPEPLPETIQLGHGSGGVMTRELLDRIIFETFSNPLLDQKHDGAVLETQGKVALSTDSFVVSPIFFRGGNIGELAVNGTVNDVAMCGGRPKYLSLSFILEEGLPMEAFRKVVHAAKKAADHAGVQIVTGDTKVVEKGKGDKVFINTTGIGPMHPEADIALSRVQQGDALLISGPVAAHGMAILSEREGLEFESEILSDTACLSHMVLALLDRFGPKVHLMRDPTRGGVSAVCTEIASDRGLGIALREADIPLDRQVAAACEILGLDPLYVANEGVVCVLVAPDIAAAALEVMKQFPEGRSAVQIGSVVSEHPGQVVMQSQVGGRRIVTPLLGEQLPRIC